ncbi:rod shape-determining protein MreC [Aerococcus suis]|uniref:Cell shape-determining protein MreC n=1 Tax=Aerococcus suis TaxID=371602 RepID=A0A1W1Y5P2_9LACT|nr:rod shape-determining protein MreC [Aerococcus suis]MDD7758340.1 rod shape-determining protein MreC [Aerococcus suis]MDY4646452.1 rod shape-determining protein MreC [Aerococcus suis]SMC31463.1 rod shape-determining protein MreC [Aerococcus suis]
MTLRQFFGNKKLIVILVSVITAFSMISFSIFGQNETPKPVLWVNDVTAIIGRIVSAPTNSLVRFSESINSLVNTYDENKSLKKQVNSLEDLKAQNKMLKSENEELSDLLSLRPSLVGKNIITSTVITRSPDSWIDNLTIDVGSNNGVEKNMSVMTDSGLVGHVSEVSPTSSKVQLLSTENEQVTQVAVSIQLDDQIVHGVISGFDKRNDEIIVTQIPAEAKVKKGDTVTTSGLGGVSPEGLIVGEVVDSKKDNHGLSQKVTIKPAADFIDIRHVIVVMPGDETENTENTNQPQEVTEDGNVATESGEGE